MITRRRVAFTLIEILMSLTIVALLASIAVPKYRDIRRRATATQILGDYDVVRHAVLSFYVDSSYFPPEQGKGVVPNTLKNYLPNGFKMKKPQWELDYENWSSKGTKWTKTGVVIGLSFTTPDSNLGRTAMKLMGNTPSVTVGSRYTLLISAF